MLMGGTYGSTFIAAFFRANASATISSSCFLYISCFSLSLSRFRN
jgi:hypothetical protein